MRSSNSQKRRVGLAALTSLRAYRMQYAITSSEVSERARRDGAHGLTTHRVSIIERDPSLATPEEIEAHRAAVDAIAAERGVVGVDEPGEPDNLLTALRDVEVV